MPALAAWLLPLQLVSCLEFEAQDVHLRYDAGSVRLDILLIYRGLYAGDNDLPVNDQTPPLERALADLKQAREQGAFALRSSMNFKVDPVDQAATAWVGAHIDVEYGGLFTDPRGRLSGYQFVRVRSFRKFMRLFDAAHRELLFALFGPVGEDRSGWPDATKQAFARFLEQGEAVVSADGCCFEVRLPIGDREHEGVKRRVLGDGGEAAERPAGPADPEVAEEPAVRPHRVTRRLDPSPRPQSFGPNELTVGRVEGVTIVRFGTPGDATMHVEIPCEGESDTRLLEELRRRADPIEEGVPDQVLLRRFEAFGERDARLPTALAALRR